MSFNHLVLLDDSDYGPHRRELDRVLRAGWILLYYHIDDPFFNRYRNQQTKHHSDAKTIELAKQDRQPLVGHDTEVLPCHGQEKTILSKQDRLIANSGWRILIDDRSRYQDRRVLFADQTWLILSWDRFIENYVKTRQPSIERCGSQPMVGSNPGSPIIRSKSF